jgi:hypothetical protein
LQYKNEGRIAMHQDQGIRISRKVGCTFLL